MFKLIAIEDVQHAGEGRVVCLHYLLGKFDGPRVLGVGIIGRVVRDVQRRHLAPKMTHNSGSKFSQWRPFSEQTTSCVPPWVE